jgi:hypothetical protein
MDPMQLIDHPPRDAERRPDPAFTDAVMSRVRHEPRAASGASWWIGAAAVAAASLCMPADGVLDVDAIGAWFDPALLVESAIAAAIAASVWLVVSARTRISP